MNDGGGGRGHGGDKNKDKGGDGIEVARLLPLVVPTPRNGTSERMNEEKEDQRNLQELVRNVQDVDLPEGHEEIAQNICNSLADPQRRSYVSGGNILEGTTKLGIELSAFFSAQGENLHGDFFKMPISGGTAYSLGGLATSLSTDNPLRAHVEQLVCTLAHLTGHAQQRTRSAPPLAFCTFLDYNSPNMRKVLLVCLSGSLAHISFNTQFSGVDLVFDLLKIEKGSFARASAAVKKLVAVMVKAYQSVHVAYAMSPDEEPLTHLLRAGSITQGDRKDIVAEMNNVTEKDLLAHVSLQMGAASRMRTAEEAKACKDVVGQRPHSDALRGMLFRVDDGRPGRDHKLIVVGLATDAIAPTIIPLAPFTAAGGEVWRPVTLIEGYQLPTRLPTPDSPQLSLPDIPVGGFLAVSPATVHAGPLQFHVGGGARAAGQ